MKKQILAVGIVFIILFSMYCNVWIASKFRRVFSELAPGGFVVSYYADTNFDARVARRSERKAVVNYGEGRPARGVPVNNHSARWEGWVTISEAADYKLFLQSQGSARIWIGDTLVVDKWDDLTWSPGAKGQIGLDKGIHKVTIEHHKSTGPGAIRLRWAGGDVPGNTVMGVPHVRKKGEL